MTAGPEPDACNPTESGEEFFRGSANCALCHGPDGNGITDLGPEVHHPPEDYARWIIRNGRMGHPDFAAGMVAYDECVVSDEMIDEILEYLNSFPKPTDGAGLYADYCANCHGANGRGGVTGRSLDGELHEIESITEEGHNPNDFGDRREYMPVMTDLLTAGEIQLISDYLQDELGLEF